MDLALDALVTLPGHQRRGAGTMLLQWGCSIADDLGLITYLEATAVGRPLYEKVGFEEVGRNVKNSLKYTGEDIDDIDVFMIRQPRKTI